MTILIALFGCQYQNDPVKIVRHILGTYEINRDTINVKNDGRTVLEYLAHLKTKNSKQYHNFREANLLLQHYVTNMEENYSYPDSFKTPINLKNHGIGGYNDELVISEAYSYDLYSIKLTQLPEIKFESGLSKRQLKRERDKIKKGKSSAHIYDENN